MAALVFANADELSAFKVPSDHPAATAYILGHSTIADGGEGRFVFHPGATAEDDGGTVIAPRVGGGRWLRAEVSRVSVRWFGAKGDESQSDTEAFNRAIAAAIRRAGDAEVYVPPGHYLIGAPGIKAGIGQKGATLVGAGRDATTLNVQTGKDVDGITWQSPTPYGRNGGLRAMTVWSPGPTSSRDLISIRSWSGMVLERLSLRRAGRHNIFVDNATFLGGRDVHSSFAGDAGLMLAATEDTICTTSTFTNSYFSNNRGPGCDIDGLGLSFFGCVFESNGMERIAEGVRVRGGSSTFTGCYWEDNAGDDLAAGYDRPAPPSSGSSVTVINPFMQAAGRLKSQGKGGFRVHRGDFVFVGPGEWLNITHSIVVEKAHEPKVTIIGLPERGVPRPSFADGSPFPN